MKIINIEISCLPDVEATLLYLWNADIEYSVAGGKITTKDVRVLDFCQTCKLLITVERREMRDSVKKRGQDLKC